MPLRIEACTLMTARPATSVKIGQTTHIILPLMYVLPMGNINKSAGNEDSNYLMMMRTDLS
jgi:hypothetical protein